MKTFSLPDTPPRWLTIGTALPLVVWPMFCMASAMAFDATGSENNVALLLFVAAVMLYPFTVGGSWCLRRLFVSANMRNSAYAVALLPLLNLLIAGAALRLVATACGGELVCP